MLLRRAPLLLLWEVLGSLVPGGRGGSPRHSLRYSYLNVSESSRGLPQFLSVILLDDQPIARNRNHTRAVELLVPWMGAEDKNFLVGLDWALRDDLERLSNHNHQTEGLHTWQAIFGCELGEDGSKGGFLHYGYNGMDFISFDKETLRWVAAQPQAKKITEKWNNETWRASWNNVSIETCIEMMQKYPPNQTESLKKTEPPLGKVTCKVVNDSLEVLICQAFGFYPKEIQAIWTRDGEACKYETLPRNVAPNSDGTYYVWLSIEIDPKERDRFRCRLEHEGLQEPPVLVSKEETDPFTSSSPTTQLPQSSSRPDPDNHPDRTPDTHHEGGVWWLHWGIVGAVVVVLLILFVACCGLKYREKIHQAMTTRLPLEKLCSSSPDGTEDAIQPAAMPPPKMTSEGCCGQQTELREGEKTPLMASPDAYSDNVEEPAPETSEGGLEELLEEAEATKPGMEGLEEEVSPDPSEEQLDEHRAGEERGETQLQLEDSQTESEAHDGEGLQLQLIRKDEEKLPPPPED